MKRLAHSLPGAVRSRSLIVAALATITACADPALALDKVKFGTNWLADPEAGGFYQALVEGTYAKYGLDVRSFQAAPSRTAP